MLIKNFCSCIFNEKYVEKNSIDNDFKPKHIFDSLISYGKDFIAEDTINALFYYMHLSEKCLFNFRSKDVLTGNYEFNKLSQYSNYFVEPINFGMESLHKALTAYKNFVENDYSLALSNIDDALRLAVIQSNSYPYFISIVGEQTLNKIRIYIKQEKIIEALQETIDILKLYFFNIHIDENYVKYMEILDSKDKIGMIHHILNSVIISLRKSNVDYNILKDFLINIANGITNLENTSDKLLLHTERTLLLLKAINYKDKFLSLVSKNFEDFENSPIHLQKIICTDIFNTYTTQIINYINDNDIKLHEKHKFLGFKVIVYDIH